MVVVVIVVIVVVVVVVVQVVVQVVVVVVVMVYKWLLVVDKWSVVLTVLFSVYFYFPHIVLLRNCIVLIANPVFFVCACTLSTTPCNYGLAITQTPKWLSEETFGKPRW